MTGRTFRDRRRLVGEVEAHVAGGTPAGALDALQALAPHPQDGGQRRVRETLVEACRANGEGIEAAWRAFLARWRDPTGEMIPPASMR